MTSVSTGIVDELKRTRCLYENCKKPLHGRSDKKFCDDKCRNHYHNQLKSTRRPDVRKINMILGHNYRVLEQMYTQQQKSFKVTKTKLLELRFDPDYFTSISINKNKDIVYHCYSFRFEEKADAYLVSKL